MRYLLVLALLLFPLAALADDGGDAGPDAAVDAGADSGADSGADAAVNDAGPEPTFDGSLPDASEGQGGADRTSQESEDHADRVATTCRSSLDCNAGFECQAGRCTWIGYRRADRVGCLVGTDGAAFAALGLVFALRRRRGL